MTEKASPGSSIKGQSFYFMFYLKWMCISEHGQLSEQQMEPKAKFEIFKGPQIISGIKQAIVLDMKKGWCKGEKVQLCFFLKDFNPYRQIEFVVKMSRKTENGQEPVGEIKIAAGKYIEAFTNQQVAKIDQIGQFGKYNAGFLIFTQKSRHSLQKIVKVYKQSIQNNEESAQKQIQVHKLSQTLRYKKLGESQKEKEIEEEKRQEIKEEIKSQINEKVSFKARPTELDSKSIEEDYKNIQINQNKDDAEIQHVENKNKQSNAEQIEQKQNEQGKIASQDNQQNMNDTEVVELIEVEQNQQRIQPQQKPNHEDIEIKHPQLDRQQDSIKQQVNNELQHITQQVQKTMEIEQLKSSNVQPDYIINVIPNPPDQSEEQPKIQKLSSTPKHDKENEDRYKSSPESVKSFTQTNKQIKQSKAIHVDKVEEEQTTAKAAGMGLSLKIILFLLMTGLIGFAAYYINNMNKLVDEHPTSNSKRKSHPSTKAHESTGSSSRRKK